MTKKEFLQGVDVMKANYIRWEFNITNKSQLRVWYSRFEKLTFDEYKAMIENYTNTHKYPPQSPAELAEGLTEAMQSTELSAGEAWIKVLRLLQTKGLAYHSDEVYAEIKGNTALTDTVKEMHRELETMQYDDCFIAQRFKQIYEANIQRDSRNKTELVLSGNTEERFTKMLTRPKTYYSAVLEETEEER